MRVGLIRRRRFVLGVSLLAQPAGCSLLPTPETPQIYRLSPPVSDPPGPTIPRSALTIELPTASASLDTDRIALTQGRTRFDYYAASVWTDRLPTLLQTLMVEAFQADGRIADVGRDDAGLTRGYLLRTEIRRFEAEYAGPAAQPPEIAIELELQLSTGPEGRLLGTRPITARAHASENKLDSIVMAFDTAIGEALTDSVVWTTGRMRRVYR